jgi:O-antigen/teichoic acid export membrane protein
VEDVMRQKMTGVFQWARDRWRRSALLRGTSILVGGTLSAQLINLLISPIITRLYSASDFGVLGVFTAIISVVGVVTALRYEMAIPLPEKESSAYSTLILCLLITLAVSALAALAFWFFGATILSWMQAEALLPYVFLLPVGILGSGLYLILSAWAVRKKAYGRIARTRLTQSVGQSVVQILGGLLQVGPIGLVIGNVVGSTAGSVNLARLVWGADKEREDSVGDETSPASLLAVASRYRSFPLLSSWAVLLNAVGLRLPVLMLSALYGPQVAGWYFLSQRVVAIPSAIIGQAVSGAYLTEAADIHRRLPPPQAIRRQYALLRKMVLMSALIGLPYLALALAGPWLFPFVFGREWYEAGRYAQPMAFMFFLQFVSSPTGSTVSVLERQDLHMLREITRVGLVAGSLVLAAHVQAEPLTAVIYLSAAGVISYVIYLLISVYAIYAHTRRNHSAVGLDV